MTFEWFCRGCGHKANFRCSLYVACPVRLAHMHLFFPPFFFLAEMGDYSQSFNLVVSPYSNDLKAKLPVTLSHTPCNPSLFDNDICFGIFQSSHIKKSLRDMKKCRVLCKLCNCLQALIALTKSTLEGIRRGQMETTLGQS